MAIWPAGLENDRSHAVALVDVASAHVSAALGDPGRCFEAGVRSRVACRAALRYMAQVVVAFPAGRRWSGRLKVARDFVEQLAAAGIVTAADLDGCEEDQARRLLLYLLGLLSDLGYYLDVFGPAGAGLHLDMGGNFGID